MQIKSFLNGVPFEEISEVELQEFAKATQIKMLNVAGYAPIEDTSKETA